MSEPLSPSQEASADVTPSRRSRTRTQQIIERREKEESVSKSAQNSHETAKRGGPGRKLPAVIPYLLHLTWPALVVPPLWAAAVAVLVGGSLKAWENVSADGVPFPVPAISTVVFGAMTLSLLGETSVQIYRRIDVYLAAGVTRWQMWVVRGVLNLVAIALILFVTMVVGKIEYFFGLGRPWADPLTLNGLDIAMVILGSFITSVLGGLLAILAHWWNWLAAVIGGLPILLLMTFFLVMSSQRKEWLWLGPAGLVIGAALLASWWLIQRVSLRSGNEL